MELLASDLDLFETMGYLLLPEFLSGAETAAIRAELEQLIAANALVAAGIGKKEGFQVDASQRGDFIRWIDPEALAPATAVYFERMDGLISLLNRTFYLGIRDRECHYTQYPVGSFYKRHVDRHRGDSPRVVSLVFYLNQQWEEGHGGELMLYHTNGSSTRVMPKGGTLAVFLSEKEHEVLPTQQPRQSITGWMLNEHRMI